MEPGGLVATASHEFSVYLRLVVDLVVCCVRTGACETAGTVLCFQIICTYATLVITDSLLLKSTHMTVHDVFLISKEVSQTCHKLAEAVCGEAPWLHGGPSDRALPCGSVWDPRLLRVPTLYESPASYFV